MQILLVHPNFPGQYAHLAPALAARPGTRVAAISARQVDVAPGIDLRVYDVPPPVAEEYRYARFMGAAFRRAEKAGEHALALRREGFRPDVVACHLGWGDALFLKDVFPDARMLLYSEFFYSVSGADVGFGPGETITVQDAMRVRAMNAPLVSAMQAADWGVAPTRWQRDRFPPWFRQRISLVHEGVDTQRCAPVAAATVTLPDGTTFHAGDEVVSYVARGLEPYRGFPTFLRALPELMRRRPNAHVVLVGGEEVRYGRSPRGGGTWKDQMLQEVQGLDPARMHFTGLLPYPTLLDLFRVAAAHVYLTVPFVLSWSTLEAMSCGALLLGSATPPVQEVIQDGRNGLLTDFFDSAALAERLVEVLSDPGRYAPLRQAARRTILERYDLQRVCLPRQLAMVDALAAGRAPATYA
ncbi:glycosyltransferase family 4 protein [Roseomonas sp. OT10]|uniref:glycosyltransferase family 4 protein n=1 Tax=Roseomonas cutis TaxID=2897332 RepID=UPI001E58FCE6|nr:glycosyltransferase family 4 protein [Roseomonas sp. OT10]UFN51096.1 glycosyltransferase family 4 protein [Roseomonas sp. OT10]